MRQRPAGRAKSALNILDTLSLYRVGSYYAEQGRPTTVAYRDLLGLLGELRTKLGMRPADGTVAVVAHNPDNLGQGRFVDALIKLGIDVVAIDFWEAYASVPGLAERAEPQAKIQTVAPTLAYLLGLLAGRDDAQVIMVTSIFDVYHPLRDFVETRGGRAALAFFRRHLDARWGQTANLFAPGSRIPFEDLEPHSKRVLGIDVVDSGARGLGAI